MFAGRALELVAELADGSLQGLDFQSTAVTAVLRLTSAGSPAPGFGTSGAKPIQKAPVTFPSTYEPSGEWFAPVSGRFTGSWSIGLIRCAPDGTIDSSFGAGAASPTADRFVPTASILNLTPRAENVQFEPEAAGRHQTLRLADGTYLTLWSVTFDLQLLRGGSMSSRALVLVAWDGQGVPRTVPAWGRPAKAIAHPAPGAGWRFRTALLQSDGSVVGLAGDDTHAVPPPLARSPAYFCRLLPGSFDLDPAFGGGGRVARRLPGEDEKLSSGATLVDYQLPEALRPLGANAVMAAVRCETGSGPRFPGFFNQSPHLLADGSVGLVRLV